jgi:hypothetical protein
MTNLKISAGMVALAGFAGAASAGLIDTRYDFNPWGSAYVEDGIISANEYGPGNAHSFTGAGSGFGGTLGQGTIFMDYSLTDLNIGVQLANNLNDNIVIFLDTRPGGQTDATMDDQADGGRRISSNLTRDVMDNFNPAFLPDFSVVIGSFGIVVFELNAGNTPGHLQFHIYEGHFTGISPTIAREINIPRSLLGLTAPLPVFHWLAGYGSNDPFMSNESIPIQPFNAFGNPGFDNSGVPLEWPNYNRFEAVPEPATMLALGAGLAALLARRRRKN